MRFIMIFFVCLANLAKGQPENDLVAPLSHFIETADSILITQNENSAALREDENDQSGLIISYGKVNDRIVEKKMWLASKDRSKLRKIFIRSKRGYLGDGASCFEPHHTIIFFMKSKCYPVEICFRCVGIRKPEKIIFSLDKEFDKRKWDMLEGFFKARGFDVRR